MGLFLAVSSANPVIDIAEEQMLRKLDRTLNVQYTERFVFLNSEKNLAVAVWCREDPLLGVSGQIDLVTDQGAEAACTTLQGWLWEKDAGRDQAPDAITARDIGAWCEQYSPDAIRDRCNGEFSLLKAWDSGRLMAFNDRLSIEPLYYGSKAGRVYVSNRVSLIATAMGNWEHDVETLGWMGVLGHLIGEGTSVKGISRLFSGACLEVDKGRCEVKGVALSVLDPNLTGVEEHFDEYFEKAFDQCVTNITASLKADPSIPVPLSGGKDSRAVLGLVLRAGLIDRVSSYTNGYAGHPDVVVAQQIVEHYGIAHQHNIPVPTASVGLEGILYKLMSHVFQVDGMLTAWDSRGYHQPGRGLVLAGHIGEVYRGYTKGEPAPQTVHAGSRMYHKKNSFDPAGLLKRGARRMYERALEDRAQQFVDLGGKVADIPDFFYVFDRLANWVGAIRRHDGHSVRIINPLNTQGFITLAFALGFHQRQIERIHFEIVNRADPWLAEQPFACDKWHKDLDMYAGKGRLNREPVNAPGNMPVYGSWQYAVDENPYYRACLEEILFSEPKSDIWGLFNRSRVEQQIRRAPHGFLKLYSLYGLLTAFMWRHDLKVPMKLREIHGHGTRIAQLLRIKGSGAVFLYDGFKGKRILRAWDEIAELGFSGNDVEDCPRLAMAAIPGLEAGRL